MSNKHFKRGGFLRRFFNQCGLVDLQESDKEERDRYDAPPWNAKILNWINWKRLDLDDDS